MRFGINTFLFTSPFTNQSTKLFSTFKKWGFETVEIPIEDPSHIDPAHVRRELDRHGLVCGSACACMGPGRDFRGSPAEQQTAMDYCKTLIDQTVVLGCPSLIGPVYSVVGKADAVEPARQKTEWAMVVKNLKELASYAEARGRQICIEPLNRFETDFLNTCDKGLKLIRAVGSKAVKLHLDTFHMNIEEKFQGPAIRKAGRLLGHFHACGSDRGTPGNDHIDWKPIAAALKSIGYRGDVVIESFTTDVKVIARAAAIWRRIEPTRDEIAVKGLKFLKKTLAGLVLCATTAFSALAASPGDEAGFKALFNGHDLAGWAGRPQHWSVEDGAITGRTTKEHPAQGNNFLIWTNGTVGDFELRLSYKIVPNNTNGFANSGIQYRSKDFDNFVVGGYQADFEAGKTYSGILYEERMDGILAQRGQKTAVRTVDGKTKIEVLGSLGKSENIQAKIKDKDWNDYVVIAQGNRLQHFINGAQTVDVLDEREGGKAAKEGILALQLHAGDPMTVQFKNIRLKTLSGSASANSDIDRLQGEWVPIEIIANGNKASQEDLDRIKVKIKGNRYFVESADPSQGTFRTVELDTPKKMDVTSDDGAELPAIYELSGDTFKACYSINGASRPTEFKSADGSDHILAVYKRKSP